MTIHATLSLSPKTIPDSDTRVQAVLERAQAQLGFIPNMYAGMANAPGLLDTYLDGYARFRGFSGFTPAEQEIVFLTISRENGCHYCMAAHSMIADKMSNVPPDVLKAIRHGEAIPDPKLATLSAFVEHLLTTRGRPTVASLSAFLEVGYSQRQVLELVLAIAVKTLSNYANHLLDTEVDERFAGYSWNQGS